LGEILIAGFRTTRKTIDLIFGEVIQGLDTRFGLKRDGAQTGDQESGCEQ
jgi:hypothetical protein